MEYKLKLNELDLKDIYIERNLRNNAFRPL
jgi:hypothetical protein